MKIAAVLSYYSKCQHLIQIGIFDRARHATTQRRSQMIEQHTSVYVLKQQLRPSFIAILLEQGSQLNSNIIISISIQNTDADAFEKQIQIREIAH